MKTLLPAAPALVLDIGTGGRQEAAWLASLGLDVVAVSALSSGGSSPDWPSSVRWIDDRLPTLERTYRLGASFDLILLGDPWARVALTEKARAFRKLVTLLKPGGRLVFVLHHDADAAARAASARMEIETFAREHGLSVELSGSAEDGLQSRVSLRLPDDGTGALPLLRHIILNDQKSATYKLALLRVLCRIADSAAGQACDADDDHVGVPLGLVALYWIRMFMPLLRADLPQATSRRGLGFVTDAGYRKLSDVSHLDLRIGGAIAGDRLQALHRTLRDTIDHIKDMPARHTTYAAGEPVFPIIRKLVPRAPDGMNTLDVAYLSAFGRMLVPRHLWRAFQRFDVWIEPSLTAEWKRLIQEYAKSQAKHISPDSIDKALRWSDPTRDVGIARQRALQLLETRKLHCVWTGTRLTADTLDIDHCFPWSAWPCEDLWNLMPAHRRVNQKEKRERLPGLRLLRTSQDRIVEWWNDSYIKANDALLSERFIVEARSTLPTLRSSTASPEDIFAAVALQQVRLKHDQQVPVWEPET